MKLIGLVDCNSFYCSCERIFRPDLVDKAVVVLSNNDGCAISRTTEAKAMGIEMGAPYFKIKEYCKHKKIEIFSSNFSLYTDISRRVMKIIHEECPKAEVYSVDEAFIDITGIKDPKKFIEKLKEKILKETKIPVSIGVGRTKVLAKIANNLAKKSLKSKGLIVLENEKLEDIALERTPIGSVWGIGNANKLKMQNLGINTAKDLKDYKNKKLIGNIFTKVGLQLKEELEGISLFSLEENIDKKKEIMCSRTFGENIYSKEELSEAIACYITDVAKKLREQDSLCTKLTIFARTNPFKENLPQYYMHQEINLGNPTNNTFKLIKEGIKLLEKGFKDGFEYRKAGVRVSSFYESYELQLNFLEENDTKKEQDLMQAVDKINFVIGENKINSLACGIKPKAWKMKQEHKSPRYTTCWDELFSFK